MKILDLVDFAKRSNEFSTSFGCLRIARPSLRNTLDFRAAGKAGEDGDCEAAVQLRAFSPIQMFMNFNTHYSASSIKPISTGNRLCLYVRESRVFRMGHTDLR